MRLGQGKACRINHYQGGYNGHHNAARSSIHRAASTSTTTTTTTTTTTSTTTTSAMPQAGRPATQDHRSLRQGDPAYRQLFRLQDRQSQLRSATRVFHGTPGHAFLERCQARPVRSEVLLNPCTAQALGGYHPDQTSQDIQNSRYPFHRAGGAVVRRNQDLELQSLLFHLLQHGSASW